jgi:PIN domain nuclease of toxin-antitoxin system
MKILDSSAVLAFLLGEPGGQVARQAFSTGLMCSVNYGEVITRYSRTGVAVSDITPLVSTLGFGIEPFTEEQAVLASRLYSKRHLSLGDRACVALAQSRKLPVMTADRAWASLDLPVTVELIR